MAAEPGSVVVCIPVAPGRQVDHSWGKATTVATVTVRDGAVVGLGRGRRGLGRAARRGPARQPPRADRALPARASCAGGRRLAHGPADGEHARQDGAGRGPGRERGRRGRGDRGGRQGLRDPPDLHRTHTDGGRRTAVAGSGWTHDPRSPALDRARRNRRGSDRRHPGGPLGGRRRDEPPGAHTAAAAHRPAGRDGVRGPGHRERRCRPRAAVPAERVPVGRRAPRRRRPDLDPVRHHDDAGLGLARRRARRGARHARRDRRDHRRLAGLDLVLGRPDRHAPRRVPPTPGRAAPRRRRRPSSGPAPTRAPRSPRSPPTS